jgi:hypothetical protein
MPGAEGDDVMIGFLRAHGMTPGPLQHPMTAGAFSAGVALAPAGAVFVALGSFAVAADKVLNLPRPLVAGLMIVGFAVCGALYGLIFQRAANDRTGGPLFGAIYGFVLWMAAPIVVLPLVGAQTMAAGRAATGFLAAFLIWGAVTGALFPYVHKPLQAQMDGGDKPHRGAGGVVRPHKLLRRIPRRWR